MNVEDAVLEVLKAGSPTRRRTDLWVLVNRRLQRTVSPEGLQGAIDALRARGLISYLPGAADKVTLVAGDLVTPAEGQPLAPSAPTGEPPPEARLMPALGEWIRSRFMADLGEQARSIVRDTSRGGPPRGPWSRPDYAVASVRAYAYSTLREVDLYGFELKRAGAATVIGVHEALAHTRWVHFSYLVLHAPDREGSSSDFEIIFGECARHGVGMIKFSDPDALDSWSIALEPERRAVDQLSVDEFINERFDETERSQLKRWLVNP